MWCDPGRRLVAGGAGGSTGDLHGPTAARRQGAWAVSVAGVDADERATGIGDSGNKGGRQGLAGEIEADEGKYMKYKIILNKSEEGYSVSCPSLPGCWSQGSTKQEAVENIQDTIQEYLAAISESIHDFAY